MEHWDGWQGIYDEYYAKLKTAGAADIYAKQKYGFLRFEVGYMENADHQEIERLIEEAEEISLTICADCGGIGAQTDIGGWIYTLCKNCRRDKEKYNPANISVPPFERLPDGSYKNVFTVLTPEKEKQQRQKMRDILKKQTE